MRKLKSMQSSFTGNASHNFSSNFSHLFTPYIKESGSLLETMQASTTITAIPPLLEKAFAQNIISSLELKLFGPFPNSKKLKYFDYI